jgi:hypothetical protein
MDDTQLRAIIREEIALATKTLEDQAYSSDPDDDVDLERALSSFNTYAYRGACEAADEQRARDTDPFEATHDPGPDPTVTAAIRAEMLGVLKDMRSAFYMSGSSDDYRIAERLDGLITAREAADE